MQTKDIKTVDVLSACKEFHSQPFRGLGNLGKAPWQIIMEKYNAPEKVIYSAMEREVGNGFIEYGTSLRTGWLTVKGEEKLCELINL